MSARFQVNAYLTPPSAQGFATHCDTHDVFVLQISGVKRWSVFDTEVELPLRESRRPPDVSGEPLFEQELRPGDLLYIPRGFPHHAVSADATSLHLTVGAHPPTWATLIRAAVEERIDQDVRFRAALPLGFAANDSVRKHATTAFRDLLSELTHGIDAAALVDDAASSIRLAQLPALSGRLIDIESESRIDETTPVQRRPEVDYEISVDAERIQLGFGGKILFIPSSAATELRHLLESGECAANQLPGKIDSQGRVVLIRRLVREGLLTLCRDRSHSIG
ncbi:cupin domain-containing protein [Nocardia sp. NPDC050713]|uniref:cupin domain-containing protein n=1 Tax=Nocardia sp. NPDC050713 TaxID=3154511 RepID=UPI003404D2FD